MMPRSLPSWLRYFGLALTLPATLISTITFTSLDAEGQTPTDSRALSINSDIQEANSQTGVYTARGNVQLYYPARQIQATSAQAQYFSRERRIVLNGDVYVLQQGNSIRGETVTYLIDEGRFIAAPKADAQVQSIYIITDSNPTQPATAPAIPSLNSQPAATPAPSPADPEP